jgi:hypothetical protein
MREQKELPSFPKECGHQTHNPTWQKKPSLPYSIPGNRLLGFEIWELGWQALREVCWQVDSEWDPLPLRNFKRVTCFHKYEVSLFHVFLVILSSFLIFPIYWRQSISDALGVWYVQLLVHNWASVNQHPCRYFHLFFLVRPVSGHIKLKKC